MTRNHESNEARSARGTIVRLAIMALAVAGAVGGKCEGKPPAFYQLIGVPLPGTGDVFGTVTVDGTPRSGVTVTLRQGGTVVATTTTNASGLYEFNDRDPGSYTVAVTAPSGTTCPAEQIAIVEEDEETQRNFACTTPPAQTGTISGQVTVNSAGQANVPITLRQGTTVITTQNTNTSGNFSFTGLASGAYVVSMVRPGTATCDGTVVNGSNEKTTTLPAGGTQTVNFTCAQQAFDFAVALTKGYFHTMPGVESVECGFIVTTPAQPGAPYTLVPTGPTEGGVSGIIAGQTFGGTLDAAGQATFTVRINRFGTYSNLVTVTSGGLVRPITRTVNVQQPAGTCPGPQTSSRRFKSGVVALLPDGMSLLGLRPVAFRYRAPWGDPAAPQVGLIAEEVFRVFPAAVVLEADGRPYGIDYRALTGLVIGEIDARVRRTAAAGIERFSEALE